MQSNQKHPENNKYPEIIEFCGQKWAYSNFIKMKKGAGGHLQLMSSKPEDNIIKNNNLYLYQKNDEIFYAIKSETGIIRDKINRSEFEHFDTLLSILNNQNPNEEKKISDKIKEEVILIISKRGHINPIIFSEAFENIFAYEKKAMRNYSLLMKYDCFNEQKKYLDNKCLQGFFEVKDIDGLYVKKSNQMPMDDKYIYVLTCEVKPRLLCCKEGEYHHSYLSNGLKVLATGEMKFKKGILRDINNNSGHYRPTDEEMLRGILAFYVASGCTLETYTSYCDDIIKTYSVEELFKNNGFSNIQPLQNNETNTSKRRFNKPLNIEGAKQFALYRFYLQELSTPEGKQRMADRQKEIRQQKEMERIKKEQNPDDGYLDTLPVNKK